MSPQILGAVAACATLGVLATAALGGDSGAVHRPSRVDAAVSARSSSTSAATPTASPSTVTSAANPTTTPVQHPTSTVRATPSLHRSVVNVQPARTTPTSPTASAPHTTPVTKTKTISAAQKQAAAATKRAKARRAALRRLHETTPTSWQALNVAIWRIPNYRPGLAHWSVTDKGAWGATDLSNGKVYIAPRTPLNKLYDVASHEYAHVLQGRMYGSQQAAIRATAAWYGTSSELSIEREADCAARLEGAHWTWYTSCTNSRWREGARLLLEGKPLP